MNLEELEFDFPSNLIALEPKFPRDESKLVVLENQPEIIKFKNILNLLKANDVLVINNTKVLNSDLLGLVNHKKVFLNLNKINNKKNNEWLVFIKSKKKIKCGEIISFDSGLKCKVIKINCEHYNKNYTVRFSLSHKKFIEYLNLNGNIPLPPYIKKKRERKLSDNKNYQTIFAEKFGAVAAPTASLHFTENLLKKLKKKKLIL